MDDPKVCPKCGAPLSKRSERLIQPEPDDGIRVAWECDNGHVLYGGKSWLK